MALNVMMMGGRGCGKTSTIVSIFNQMVNGPARQVFTICDNTKYVTIKHDDSVRIQNTLLKKQLELEYYLENEPTGVFLMDSSPTRCSWTYSLGLQIPGTNKKLNFDFYDYPGPYFEYGVHYDMMEQFVKESDICIIMVDTPYIMECGDAIAKGINCIGDIHNLMAHISCWDENWKSAKMVLFVPVKCEKYAKEGRLSEVADRIKSLYAATITMLCAFRYITIAVIPIQTIGNIEFLEMKETFVLNNRDRCCKISEQWLRMSDGSAYKLKPTDELFPDMESVLTGYVHVHKPMAWYHVSLNRSLTENGSLYNPYNCDQILLHILNFYLEKAQACFRYNNRLRLMAPFLPPRFDNMTLDDINKWTGMMNQIIKNDIEGIVYIKTAIY